MELADLVKLGIDDLMDKAIKGELRGRHAWTALKGAARFRRAIAKGDVATEGEQARRAGICSTCPSRTSVAKEGIEATVHWCGPALEDRLRQKPPTCGCLVGLTISGTTYALPAGKAIVASEECPQGRW